MTLTILKNLSRVQLQMECIGVEQLQLIERAVIIKNPGMEAVECA